MVWRLPPEQVRARKGTLSRAREVNPSDVPDQSCSKLTIRETESSSELVWRLLEKTSSLAQGATIEETHKFF